MNTPLTYNQHASFEAVLRKLVALRLNAGMKRHRLHFWHQFNPNPGPCKEHHEPIDDMMPPRRQWIRPRKAKRKHKTAFENMELMLYSTIMAFHAKNQLDKVEWGRQLLTQINVIQKVWKQPDAWNPNPPDIRPMRDSGKERIISHFTDITDRVILSLAAKYLTKAFDVQWTNSSFAFRAPGSFCMRSAVESVLDYVEQFPDTKLYVAECDIQQFYDSLSHDVVRERISHCLRLSRETGQPVSSKAMIILEKFLDSFDFRKTVLPKINIYNQEHPHNTFDIRLPHGLDHVHGRSFVKTRIGIPQGGALSPLIANIVLDFVDRAVLSTNDPDLFYARYCDDMILIHPKKSKCQAAMDRYLDALKKLKLLPHAPIPITDHQSTGDKAKSKAPYLWTTSSTPPPESARWVQFLGYKIWRDGTLSLRQKTLNRHKEKLHRVVAITRRMVTTPRLEGTAQKPKTFMKSELPSDQQDKLSGVRFLDKIRRHMVSAAVGRENLMQEGIVIRQPCWGSAFDLLARNPANEAIQQLKNLDRDREKKIMFLAYQFCKLGLMPPKPEHEDGPDKTKKKKFLGAPFSYYSIAGPTSHSKLKQQPGPQRDGLDYGHI